LKHIAVIFYLFALFVQGLSTNAESAKFIEFEPYALSLTSTDIQHGEKQLQLMMSDRPEMRKFISKGDRVWTWIVNQFAGASTGFPISWINHPTGSMATFVDPSYSSYYSPAIGNAPAYLTVSELSRSGSGHVDGEQMWASLIFELFNIRNAKQVTRIEDLAISEKISKEQFIIEITRIEYDTLMKSAAFYSNVWKTNSQAQNLLSHAYYWHLPLEDTYDEWIHKFANKFEYPWSVYGHLYETLKVRKPQIHRADDILVR
jgi:hypothetical protein